jgi:hypothetical protein
MRADRKRTFEQLKARAQAMARYQEGEEPAEDASAVIAQAGTALAELERLMRQINKTNLWAQLPSGQTLTSALAERDVLRMRHSLLTAVADAGAGHGPGRPAVRQLRSELRFIAAVPVASLRDEANELAKRYRVLDAQIQQVNWTVDLVED